MNDIRNIKDIEYMKDKKNLKVTKVETKMEIKLGEEQRKILQEDMQKSENKIQEIRDKYHISDDEITSEERYVLDRQVLIKTMKSIIEDVFYKMSWEDNALLSAESKELKSLSNEVYYKVIEVENKLQDIYENIVKTKRWLK